MTCMVNSQNSGTAIKDSSDWFAEAKASGYLAGGGYEQKWWNGRGGFVDYENPAAMAWWRKMQKQVLDLGIDGWKLDDAAFYFNLPFVGVLGGTSNVPPASEHENWPSNRAYVDHFYRDEYQHGLAMRGSDFITLARLDRQSALSAWLRAARCRSGHLGRRPEPYLEDVTRGHRRGAELHP